MNNYDRCFACGVSVCSGGCGMPVNDVAPVMVNGVECYGLATIGANYEVNFVNEFSDFVATDIECNTWAQVVKHLSHFKGIVQIVAC